MKIARSAEMLAACGIAMVLGAPAQGADASPWINDVNSAIRLIAGSNNAEAEARRAGIEIKMQPGWHTYWRYPGDSGVPPRFDFSDSDNVAAVTVRYPAPHAFTDETGTIIGYTDDVVFPLRVVPRRKGDPAMLRLKFEYAVCQKLCVPVEAKAELKLDRATGADNALLAAAEARVPRPVSAAEAGLTVRRSNDGKQKALVVVDLATAAGRPIELFVEGPTADWALPVPKPVDGASAGHQRFNFELDGLPPGADPKRPVDLTFTVVKDGGASEVRTHLD